MFGFGKMYNRGIVAENPDYCIKEFESFVNYAKTMGWIDNVKLFSDACKVRKENGFAVIEFSDVGEFEVSYLSAVFGGECNRPLCSTIKDIAEQKFQRTEIVRIAEKIEESENRLTLDERAAIMQRAIQIFGGFGNELKGNRIDKETEEFLINMVGKKFYRAAINAALNYGKGCLYIPPRDLIFKMYKAA